ncbi:MAG TPA: hypothetical protein VJV21_04830 [Pyrinomonadaceae bacterium]|nr:hypothetical protein [Pyrinomonadaceae bacterium]
MNTSRAVWSLTLRFSIAVIALAFWASAVRAASWQGLEPFKSRRGDVLQALGKPLSDPFGGPVTFKILGGTASISFVDANFVRAKKLQSELEGTVLQIILQHESSSDTPDSMGLLKNRDFTREEAKDALIFRNLKEGVVYTFLNGTLKTTRYTFSENQIGRARRK